MEQPTEQTPRATGRMNALACLCFLCRLKPRRPKREDNDRAKKNRDRNKHLEWIFAEHSSHVSPPWSF